MRSRTVRVAAICVAFATGCATSAEHRAVEAFERVDGSLLQASAKQALETANFQTLEALERFALQRNPKVRAAFLDWKAAVAAIPGARVWPAPMLKYAGLPLPVETRLGPQYHRLGVSQAIPWPEKFEARGEVLASKTRVAAERFEAARVKVLRSVRTPYARLASLTLLKEVLGEQILLLKQLATAVQARQSIGKASLAEAARVALLIGRLEDRVARLDAKVHGLEASIRAAAGLTAASTLPATPALPPIRPLTTGDEKLMRDRLKRHPKARVHEAVAAVKRSMVRLNNMARYPDFTVGLEWMVVDSPDDPGMAGADAGRDALMAMVGVRIPLSLGAYDAKERAAEIEATAAEARREAVIAEAEATLVKLATRIREASRRKALYTKTLAPQAKIAFEAALVNYSAARGGFKDLIELSKRLLEYRFEVVLATTDHALARVSLDYLIGYEHDATAERRAP